MDEMPKFPGLRPYLERCGVEPHRMADALNDTTAAAAINLVGQAEQHTDPEARAQVLCAAAELARVVVARGLALATAMFDLLVSQGVDLPDWIETGIKLAAPEPAPTPTPTPEPPAPEPAPTPEPETVDYVPASEPTPEPGTEEEEA